VLTFFDESVDDGKQRFDLVELEKLKLRKLAKPLDHSSKDPLRLFVTGPAGAGKSAILETMLTYCRQFSRNINHVFDETCTIVMTSLTGSSAVSIGGDTTARTFGLRLSSDEASVEEKLRFVDTRLCIIDEVGFMHYQYDLVKLSSRLQSLTENPSSQGRPFGSANLVFLGDFHQLEPIDGKNGSIYNYEHSMFFENALNCMVELTGTHRFQNCPVFSKLMPELRKGNLSPEMRKKLNSRVVDGEKVKIPSEGPVKYASHFNGTRANYNRSVFKDYLKKNHCGATRQSIPKTAIVIKSKVSWACNRKTLTPAQRKIFFQECDESTIKDGNRKTADPFLCLYSGCDVMVNDNMEVRNGIANGTTAVFRKAILKENTEPTPIKVHDHWVYSVDIEDVEELILEWKDCEPFYTGTFRVQPREKRFNTKYPITMMGKKSKVKMGVYVTHFPFILNAATTGHKLQGKSVDILVITEWHSGLNWAYVVLSRVRSIEGLYLMKKIPTNIDFKPNENCVRMEERLRNTILVTAED
jgi:hypothetical protein